MTDGMPEARVKWITYLVYIILTLQTGVIFWLVKEQTQLPNRYVRAERYLADTAKLEHRFDRLEVKFDEQRQRDQAYQNNISMQLAKVDFFMKTLMSNLGPLLSGGSVINNSGSKP